MPFTDNGNFKNNKWYDKDLAQFFFDRLGKKPGIIRPNNVIMSGKYVPGDSFALHTDTGLFYSPTEKTRWTLLVYLNDDFEGGETVFFDLNFKQTRTVVPKRGKALMFDIDLWHKGNEVTKGQKYWIGCEIIGLNDKITV